jgi:Ca2+-binding RTX toxin-like protein
MANLQDTLGLDLLTGDPNLDEADILDGLGGDDSLTGFRGNDLLLGREGDDNLDFSDGTTRLVRSEVKAFRATIVADGNLSGNDMMEGGPGDDWYGVDSLGDVVTERANEGTDTVFANTLSFDLRIGDLVNVENIVVLDPSAGQAYTFIGNAGANIIVGGPNGDVLRGEAGDDTLVGSVLLDGEIDTMLGGAGDDTYEVDTQAENVVERAGQGFDTIRYSFRAEISADATPAEIRELNRSKTTFSLNTAQFQNVEGLVFGGAGLNPDFGDDPNLPLVLEGNRLSNEIIGGGFDDRLLGLRGNDTMVGGEGADRMEGGAGNDYYVVDRREDVVVEGARAGTDTIATGLASFTLNNAAHRNVENLFADDVIVDRTDNVLDFEPPVYTYTETPRSHRFVGNGLDNKIVGGKLGDVLFGLSGDDWLVGGDGVDRLVGGRGNDEYDAESGDRVVELRGQGEDVIRTTSARYTLPANVEDLVFGGKGAFVGVGNGLGNAIAGGSRADRLSGGRGNDALIGRGGDDALGGGSGDDVLYGGRGRDVLTGHGGEDWFVFNTRLSRAEVDTLRDFRVSSDTIFLDDAVFRRVGPKGYLAEDAFHVGARAADAEDRILYNSGSGTLAYDRDGTGAARPVVFVKLADGLQMTFADIYII